MQILNPFDLKADIENALSAFPGLKMKDESGVLGIVGEIELIDPLSQVPFETFSVELYYPPGYPLCFPKVIETGGKIERIPDRHINIGDNNTLCLAVGPEEKLLCRFRINTTRFIKDVLLPRLAEEYEVNNGGKYAREYSHGANGVWEYYFKKTDTRDTRLVLRLIDCTIKSSEPKGSEGCICGSGLKYKKCHKSVINELSHLGTKYLQFQYHYLASNKYTK